MRRVQDRAAGARSLDMAELDEKIPLRARHLVPAMIDSIAQDLDALLDGDHAAMARLLEATGRLVGSEDARLAVTDRGFAEALVAPAPTRDRALVLMRGILGASFVGRALDRATSEIYFAYGPEVVELVWANGVDSVGARGLSAEEILAQAEAMQPPAALLPGVRRALLFMAVHGEVELRWGELAARTLAEHLRQGVTLAAVARWSLSASEGIGEVFADDEALLARLTASLPPA